MCKKSLRDEDSRSPQQDRSTPVPHERQGWPLSLSPPDGDNLVGIVF